MRSSYRVELLRRLVSPLLGILVISVAGWVLLRQGSTFLNDIDLIKNKNLFAFAAVVATAGVLSVSFFLRYLQPSSRDPYSEEPQSNAARRIRAIGSEVAELRSLVHRQAAGSNALDPSALVQDIRAAASANISKDIRKEFERQLTKDVHIEQCRLIFRDDEARLQTQLGILRRRANLNLVIGVVTTLGAVLVLILTVSSVGNVTGDTKKLVAYFVPRISTVIFVEVFSFFFLKLYKSTLLEEKFYQNELTGRSGRNIAFEMALQLADSGTTAEFVRSLGVPKAEEKVDPEEEKPLDMKQFGDIIESAAKAIVTVVKAKTEG